MISPSSTSKSSLGSLGNSQHKNRGGGGGCMGDESMMDGNFNVSQDIPGSPDPALLEKKIAELNYPDLKPLVWTKDPKPLVVAVVTPMKRSLGPGSPPIVKPPLLKRTRLNKMVAGG